MDESGEITDEQQSRIWINRNRGDTAMNLVVGPKLRGLGDITGLGGIDASEITDPFTMFRILPHRHVNAVLIKHWRGIDFARAIGGRIDKGLAVLVHLVLGRITIKPPDFFE